MRFSKKLQIPNTEKEAQRVSQEQADIQNNEIYNIPDRTTLSSPRSPSHILNLQRMIGNRATRQLLSSRSTNKRHAFIQSKMSMDSSLQLRRNQSNPTHSGRKLVTIKASSAPDAISRKKHHFAWNDVGRFFGRLMVRHYEQYHKYEEQADLVAPPADKKLREKAEKADAKGLEYYKKMMKAVGGFKGTGMSNKNASSKAINVGLLKKLKTPSQKYRNKRFEPAKRYYRDKALSES